MTMTRLIWPILLLPLAAGLAQGPNQQEFQSPLIVRYVAIVPNLLLTDTGLGTGGITLRGGEGCDGIAAWANDSGYALRGAAGGGVVNVGY
jgi:hypothetical protein